MTSDVNKLLDLLWTQDVPKEIHKSIMAQSDQYIMDAKGTTDWGSKSNQLAQLYYYFPLNFQRALKVISRGDEVEFFSGIRSLMDFGSGLGAGSLGLLNSITKAEFVEVSLTAQQKHRKMISALNLKGDFSWSSNIKNTTTRELLIMSYCLNELGELPGWVSDFENLMIIEPSSSYHARKLMECRGILKTWGFHIWAPCTHIEACPLLENSKKDWCHDRVSFEPSSYYKSLEQSLPIKNKTITFSYLLASKRSSPSQTKLRLVGDVIKEKGKTRIMVCRNSKRTFFSWLKKDKVQFSLNRGDLFLLPSEIEEKKFEIRYKKSPD